MCIRDRVLTLMNQVYLYSELIVSSDLYIIQLRYILYTNIDLRENVTFPCPVGTYQPELRGDCLPCPLNTNTSVENATICPCIPGYFRAPLEGPEVACTRESIIQWMLVAISSADLLMEY